MSRRNAAIKREILPDPKFSSKVLAKFINMIMKDGKKSTAENIVYQALNTVISTLGQTADTTPQVFQEILDKEDLELDKMDNKVEMNRNNIRQNIEEINELLK